MADSALGETPMLSSDALLGKIARAERGERKSVRRKITSTAEVGQMVASKGNRVSRTTAAGGEKKSISKKKILAFSEREGEGSDPKRGLEQGRGGPLGWGGDFFS